MLIEVTAGQSLNNAIASAPEGSEIVVEAGATFVENVEINKSNLTFRSSSPENKFKVVSPNVGPAVFLRRGASFHTFTDLHVAHEGAENYALIAMADDQVTNLDDLPKEIHFNRLLATSEDLQHTKRGIDIACEGGSLKNSQILNMKGYGQDTQAIFARHGGNFLVEDCRLEGSGENVLFGGADTRISGHSPHDFTFRRCHMFKPLWWKPVVDRATGQTGMVFPDGVFRNDVWSVKNIFEVKHGKRITVENCILENNWAHAQVGFCVLFTPLNQDGTNNWTVIKDVTFQNNRIINSERGLNITGSGYHNPTLKTENLFVLNNEWIGIEGQTLMLTANSHPNGDSGGRNIHIKHNTFYNKWSLGAYADDPNTYPDEDRLQVFIENNVWTSTGSYGFHVNAANSSREAFYSVASQDSTWKDNVIGHNPAYTEWTIEYAQAMFRYDRVVPHTDIFDADGKVRYVGNDGRTAGADTTGTVPLPPTPEPPPPVEPTPVPPPVEPVPEPPKPPKKVPPGRQKKGFLSRLLSFFGF